MSPRETEEQRAARLQRDADALAARAQARQADGRRADDQALDAPVLSVPKDRRGLRRWVLAISENKVTAVLLTALLVAAWGTMRDMGAATIELYLDVPAHARALYGPSPRPYIPEDYPGVIRKIRELEARPTPAPPPMTVDDVEALRAFLATQPQAKRTRSRPR